MQALQALTFIIAILLVVILLFQVRGSSANVLGPAESSYRSRRGFEQILFRATIGIGVLFLALSMFSVFLSSGSVPVAPIAPVPVPVTVP